MLPSAIALAVILIPLISLLVRTDVPRLPALILGSDALPAIRLSAVTTTTTTILCIVLGSPLAWLLAQAHGRGAPWLRAVLTVPLVMPPVVGGVALLMAWGRNGVVGGTLYQSFGITIPFTSAAVVMAETFVAMPFYVLTVEATMRALDPRLLAMARTLGASDLRTFARVVVPLAAPGIASGAALSWARALGEFGATLTFAGSFTGRTQTAPLAVYAELEHDPATAVALSVVMLLISVIVLGALRGRWVR